jgi:hypothetical protein
MFWISKEQTVYVVLTAYFFRKPIILISQNLIYGMCRHLKSDID